MDGNEDVEDEVLAADFGTVGEIITSAKPTAKPKVSRRRAGSDSGGGQAAPNQSLPRARQLFSDHLAADPRVRSAMANMSAGERMNLLCMTELRAQLNNEVPPFIPDLLPSLRPRKGTVLEPAGWVAFRAFGLWYNVAFRCEVDSGAKRVMTFSYRVGSPIPRAATGPNAACLPIDHLFVSARMRQKPQAYPNLSSRFGAQRQDRDPVACDLNCQKQKQLNDLLDPCLRRDDMRGLRCRS